MDVDLVIVDAERDDVARRLRVAANVEVVFQRLQGDAAFAIAGAKVGFCLTDSVAAVTKGARRTRHIPAAPAIRIGGVWLEVRNTGAAQGFAFRVGHDGAGPQAGRAFIALVAGEALVVALK